MELWRPCLKIFLKISGWVQCNPQSPSEWKEEAEEQSVRRRTDYEGTAQRDLMLLALRMEEGPRAKNWRLKRLGRAEEWLLPCSLLSALCQSSVRFLTSRTVTISLCKVENFFSAATEN